MKKTAAAAALLALIASANVQAESATGTLTVTARVEGSVGLVVQSPDAQSNTVPVRISESVRTFTRTIDAQVMRANMRDGGCVLVARLQNAPAAGSQWTLEGQSISDTAPVIIPVSGTGTSTLSLRLDVSSPKAAANAIVLSVQAQ